jgi:RNA polymerase sigma factor (sigma-70 family)
MNFIKSDLNYDFNDLLVGCKNKEPKAQSELYRRYYKIVYNTCRKYRKSLAEVEDITQDVFIKLIHNINKFNGDSPAKFTSWLKMITRNHTIDTIRRNLDLLNIEDIELNSDFDYINFNIFENSSVNIESDVNNSISNLSPMYKKVITLYYLKNYTHQQIADELNINIGTSKSNLFKAKEKLSKMLMHYNNYFIND